MDRLLPQGLQKLFEKTSFSNTTILKTFFSHTKNIIHILLLFKMITVLSALQRMTPKCGNNSNKPFFLLSIMNINQHTILNCPHPFFHSLCPSPRSFYCSVCTRFSLLPESWQAMADGVFSVFSAVAPRRFLPYEGAVVKPQADDRCYRGRRAS